MYVIYTHCPALFRSSSEQSCRYRIIACHDAVACMYPENCQDAITCNCGHPSLAAQIYIVKGSSEQTPRRQRESSEKLRRFQQRRHAWHGDCVRQRAWVVRGSPFMPELSPCSFDDFSDSAWPNHSIQDDLKGSEHRIPVYRVHIGFSSGRSANCPSSPFLVSQRHKGKSAFAHKSLIKFSSIPKLRATVLVGDIALVLVCNWLTIAVRPFVATHLRLVIVVVKRAGKHQAVLSM